jgi:hypothetical protein
LLPALLLLALLLFALLLLLLLLLVFLLFCLHDKVADVASPTEEGLHFNRLLELRSVLFVQGRRRRRPARQFNAMLLICILTHLLTIYSNVAAATALLNSCCSCRSVRACACARFFFFFLLLAAEERVLRSA